MTLRRRQVLKLGAASAGAMLFQASLRGVGGYRVGIGRSASAYAATVRAVQASGEWAALDLAGRKVIVKPNLVSAKPADSGITTDPEVVRAIVDLALSAQAGEVVIVEASPSGAHFVECGYAGFNT